MKIAETEFYDNLEWYLDNIDSFKNEEDFVDQNIAEIAYEYDIDDDDAEKVCRKLYQLARNTKDDKSDCKRFCIKTKNGWTKWFKGGKSNVE